MTEASARALSDLQMYELLCKELRLCIGPVTFSTRPLYERLLAELVRDPAQIAELQARFSGSRPATVRPAEATPMLHELSDAPDSDEPAQSPRSRIAGSPLAASSPRSPSNLSRSDRESNQELKRQLRFGMSSTPIHESEPSHFPARAVSFRYETAAAARPDESSEPDEDDEEEEEDGRDDGEFFEEDAPECAEDRVYGTAGRPSFAGRPTRPSEAMHTVRATLAPRPVRPLNRNQNEFLHARQQDTRDPRAEVHFFRNVCLVGLLAVVLSLVIAYKFQSF